MVSFETIFRAAGLAATALALGGCPLTIDPETLRPPSIVAAVPAWGSGDAGKSFAATLDAGGAAFEITAVELHLARDRDAARFASSGRVRFPVAPTPVASGPLTVAVPPTTGFVTAQLVSFEWVVEFRARGGGQPELASSGVRTFRVDCPGTATTDFLASLQAAVTSPAFVPQTLTGPVTTARLNLAGYELSHGWRSFPGSGVAFIRASRGAVTPSGPLNASRPSLLLYAPGGTGDVIGTTTPNYPLTLIGFGFGQVYVPGAPPGLGCMPREAWFVHEAGWHLPDGGFAIDAVSESAPGAVAPNRPSGPPPFSRPGIGSFPPWHGRLWDVHLFVDPSGTPIVAPCLMAPAPTPQADFHPDFATCGTNLPGRAITPAGGTPFAAGGFFAVPLPPP